MNNISIFQDKLMTFFKNWSLQMIMDFYEFERELDGPIYQKYTDNSSASKEAKEQLETYQDINGFKKIVDRFLAANKLSCEKDYNIEVLMSEQSILTPFLDALARGYLYEWILYYDDNRSTTIDYILRTTEKTGFYKWKKQFQALDIPRVLLPKQKGLGLDRHQSYYLYDRICMGYGLEIIFHALNSQHSNRLSRHLDYFQLAFEELGIVNDVQQFYDKLCEKYCYWNRYISFSSSSRIEGNISEKDTVKAKKKDNLKKTHNTIINEKIVYEGVTKRIDKTAFLSLLEQICKDWNPDDVQNKMWHNLWLNLYNYLKEIGIINTQTKKTGEPRKREPYKPFVDGIVKHVFPGLKRTFNDNLGGDAPSLSDDQSHILKTTIDSFKREIDLFIRNSKDFSAKNK